MRVRQTVLSLMLVVLAAGSAHGQDKKPRKDRNLITQDELEKAGVMNLDQAVRRLRPAWLSNRGAVSITGGATVTKEQAMAVYVDGARRGGISELQMFPMEQVKEIRFFSVDEAVGRFGGDNPFGAIEVVTKK